MYKRFILIISLLCTPASFLSAQGIELAHIIGMLYGVVLRAIPVAVGIALVVFIWGVVKMLAGMKVGQSDKAVTEGKKRMVWGVVALFMVVSIWGIVEILRVTFVGTAVPSRDAPIVDW